MNPAWSMVVVVAESLAPGDVVLVGPTPGEMWAIQQADELQRHLDAKLAGRGVEAVVLQDAAQFAVVRGSAAREAATA